MTAYELAKKYYEQGNWSKDRLAALVNKGKLTKEEYREITGEDYE